MVVLLAQVAMFVYPAWKDIIFQMDLAYYARIQPLLANIVTLAHIALTAKMDITYQQVTLVLNVNIL